MRAGKGFVEAVALGVALGAISSLTNALDGPTARFGSFLANSGWVWAAVAVAAGWRLKTRGRGAVAGTLALLATTTAYYVLDSAFGRSPWRLTGTRCASGGAHSDAWLGARRRGCGHMAPWPDRIPRTLVIPVGAPRKSSGSPDGATLLGPTRYWSRSGLGSGPRAHCVWLGS